MTESHLISFTLVCWGHGLTDPVYVLHTQQYFARPRDCKMAHDPDVLGHSSVTNVGDVSRGLF